MRRHELTVEERARGGHARAEKLRADREAARQLALERLAAMTGKALARLEGLLEADDPDAYRAVKEVLDRVLGRPTTVVEHGGDTERPIVVEHRGVKLADVLNVARQAGVEPGDG